METASDRLYHLLGTISHARELMDILPSSRDIDELVEELENSIEAEEEAPAWIPAPAIKSASSGISSRLNDARSHVEDLYSSAEDSLYSLFSMYVEISSRSTEPEEEIERSFLDLTFKDWAPAFSKVESKRLLSLAMSSWTPQVADRLGWLDEMRKRINADSAVFAISQAYSRLETKVPAWWSELSVALSAPSAKKDIDIYLLRWSQRHAMKGQPSGGWSAKEWVNSLVGVGAGFQPGMVKVSDLIDPDYTPAASCFSIESHHKMVHGRLVRLFSIDPGSCARVFSLFSPRTSPVLSGKMSTHLATGSSTEREAIKSVMTSARKVLQAIEGRGVMDGHAIAEVFTDIDDRLAGVYPGQPSYSAMFHQIRSEFEVGALTKGRSPSSRKM